MISLAVILLLLQKEKASLLLHYYTKYTHTSHNVPGMTDLVKLMRTCESKEGKKHYVFIEVANGSAKVQGEGTLVVNVEAPGTLPAVDVNGKGNFGLPKDGKRPLAVEGKSRIW